jgi:PKHD-type hydroxylase
MDKVDSMISHDYYLKNQRTDYWGYALNLFSTEECNFIINTFANNNLRNGSFSGGNQDDQIRMSKLCFINSNDEKTAWLYPRIANVINTLNDQFFQFDIDKIELLQFTEYDSKYQGFYTKHLDQINQGSGFRKLSFTIQLSDESTYDGGNLNLWLGPTPDLAPKNQGSITIFPSYILHEVTPVTSGTRYSLVGWVWGPKFK